MAKNKSDKQERVWRNRIVGYGEEDPEQLLANPKNWRLHPQHQQDALEGGLEEIGWIQNVVVNKKTGNMIDGHLRVELSISKNETTVPVTYVDLTEDEESKALLTLDPVSRLAVADRDKLTDLMREVHTDSESLDDMLKTLAEESGIVTGEKGPPETFEEIDEELEGAHDLKPDMLFELGPDFGIPELKREMIPDISELPDLETWPGLDLLDRGIYEFSDETYYLYPLGAPMKGMPRERSILAFYAEDPKFEAFWDFPDRWVKKLINGSFYAAIAPNFSVWWAHPKAIHAWQFYRSQWCARYMQEAGIPVIPDIKILPGDTEEDWRLSLSGIPKNPPTIAIQHQTVMKDDYETHAKSQKRLRGVVERLQPKNILVYASRLGERIYKEALSEEFLSTLKTPKTPKGAKGAKDVENGVPNVVWLPTVMDVRRDHIQANPESKERRLK